METAELSEGVFSHGSLASVQWESRLGGCER